MSKSKRIKIDRGPRVPALLRLAYAEGSARIHRGLAKSGYGDVQPRHFAAFQQLFDRPEGARPTELAAFARVTKQSMAATIDQLVLLGYVERGTDPTDKRAQVVRFTQRGWKATFRARELVREIERDWARIVGSGRFDVLRRALEDLVAELGPRSGS